MMQIYVTSLMLNSGETEYEAGARIQAIRSLRAGRRAPIDKLAERDRLTRFWKSTFSEWQPELCRINPNFALVHVGSFRRGLLHGNLSLLPGHIPPHKRHLQSMQALCEGNAKPSARSQLPLWQEAV